MKKYIGAALLLLAACAGRTTPWDVSVREASLLSKKTGVLILDVREPQDFKKAHLEGAVSMPLATLKSRLLDLPKNKDREILVYSKNGDDSAKATRYLQDNGYRKSMNLQGGLKSWKKFGNSLVQE